MIFVTCNPRSLTPSLHSVLLFLSLWLNLAVFLLAQPISTPGVCSGAKSTQALFIKWLPCLSEQFLILCSRNRLRLPQISKFRLLLLNNSLFDHLSFHTLSRQEEQASQSTLSLEMSSATYLISSQRLHLPQNPAHYSASSSAMFLQFLINCFFISIWGFTRMALTLIFPPTQEQALKTSSLYSSPSHIF